VELHIANARFSERRTQPALVTPGRLHGDARRPGLRDPGRQGLRGVGDPFDLPRQTSIQAFETSTPTRTSPPLPCIAPPGQSERRPLVGRRIAYGRQEPRLPFACQTATPAGPGWPRSFRTNPRSERPPASHPRPRMGNSQCNPRGAATNLSAAQTSVNSEAYNEAAVFSCSRGWPGRARP
jgi:hypothetical protein